MQKLIKNDLSDICYFENDVTVSDWLDMSKYRLMTELEIKKHESNPNTDHHIWVDNIEEWVDSRTPDQLAEHNRSQMPTLSPIEFDLKLNKAGLYDAIQELIKDNFELRIAYTRAIFFSRTDPFIDQARIALNLTDEQVDEMWV